MNLQLVVTENCPACERASEQLLNFRKAYPGFNYEILDLKEYTKMRIQITPALICDGELISYGDIDKDILSKRINK